MWFEVEQGWSFGIDSVVCLFYQWVVESFDLSKVGQWFVIWIMQWMIDLICVGIVVDDDNLIGKIYCFDLEFVDKFLKSVMGKVL